MIFMNRVELKSFGKINLFLEVGEKLPNGYHNIETVFHKVGLHDVVIIEKKAENGIVIECDNASVPNDETNIVYKAAEKYCIAAGISGNYKITINKNIPVAGGMGGGSSNAAAVLCALYEIEKALSFEQIFEISCGLGADVPFFLHDCGAMYGTGTGTELSRVNPIPPCFGLFVVAGEKKSTAQAYHVLDTMQRTNFRKADKILNALANGSYRDICSYTYNVFENINSEYAEIAEKLRRNGADAAFLCGSGPTVCGLFDNSGKAYIARESFGQYRTFVSKI